MSIAQPLETVAPWTAPVRSLLAAIIVTVAQIAFACVVGTYSDGGISFLPSDLAKSYTRLARFDSQWYLWIAEEGYDAERVFQKGKTGNVAFFPAYPLLVRAVADATGWPTPICLLLVSQLACVGFWTYFFLLLDYHNLPVGQARILAILLAAQPGSFFLVAGYSESLFLFAMLGYIYWSESTHPALKWLAALHGFAMTATRIVGIPLALYPIVRATVTTSPANRVERILDAILLAIIASLGALSFFGYCQYRFGSWDLYMTSQNLGWHVRPDYFALLHAKTYLIDVDLWLTDGFLSPDWLSRAIVPLFLVAFAILLGIEIYVAATLPSSTLGDRIGYYILAVAAFYFATTALAGNDFRSMIRYILPSEILLSLEVGHLLANEDIDGVDWSIAALALAAAVPAAIVQGFYVVRFTSGAWVA